MSETDDDSSPRAEVDGSDLEPEDRTLTWWPIVGAAIIAALVGLVIVIAGPGEDNHVGSKIDNSGALACPDTYEQRAFIQDGKVQKPWVPIEPSGVGGENHLVPDTTPSHVTLCQYSSDRTDKAAAVTLSGHRTLSSGLRALTKDLTDEPKREATPTACTPPSGAQSDFLIGMRFATGLMWVSVPGNECLGAGNGSFVTGSSLTDRVTRAYGSRAWPSA